MTLPVTLEDAKRQLRLSLSDTSMDVEIGGFIEDAAAWIERYTGHILIARDVTEQFDRLDQVRLRAWPIAPGTVPVVAYGDPGAVATTITGSRLSVAKRPVRIHPPASLAWPRFTSGGVITVTIRAGYEDAADVPAHFRRVMLVLISGYDEGGEALIKAEEMARRLCSDDRPRGL